MNGYIVNIPEPEKHIPFTFTIYPNPFKTKAIFQVTSQYKMENCEIVFYNLYGKEVKRFQNISGDRIEIQSDNLGKGIYVCRVMDSESNIIGIKRIIIN